MRNVSLDAVTLEHLLALKDDGTSESRELDYKLELPGNRDDDKKEFLADVCSFANAGGGDIVFGVEEAKDAVGKNTGTIGQLRGLPGVNADEVVRRLEAMVRDGLDPRVPIVRFRWLEGGSQGPFLVLRVGRSFAGPHLVKFQNVTRFFSRNSGGKFQLDVREIRAAMLESDQGIQRARSFRLERVARIVANETPVRTGDGPRWMLHVVPVQSSWRVDVDTTAAEDETRGFRPMRTSGWSYRHNLDGLVTAPGMPNVEEAHTYSLLFRDGAVEAVDAGLLDSHGGARIIPSVAIEKYVLEYAATYVRLLRGLGVDAPLAISISFVGARGCKMGVSRQDFDVFEMPAGFDRNEVLLPEVVIDTPSVVPSQLRPLLDVMWQAAGWPRSLYFAKDGSWTPPR